MPLHNHVCHSSHQPVGVNSANDGVSEQLVFCHCERCLEGGILNEMLEGRRSNGIPARARAPTPAQPQGHGLLDNSTSKTIQSSVQFSYCYAVYTQLVTYK
jgi:hypothetical protein